MSGDADVTRMVEVMSAGWRAHLSRGGVPRKVTRKWLLDHHVLFWEQIRDMSDEELLGIPGIGKQTLVQLRRRQDWEIHRHYNADPEALLRRINHLEWMVEVLVMRRINENSGQIDELSRYS